MVKREAQLSQFYYITFINTVFEATEKIKREDCMQRTRSNIFGLVMISGTLLAKKQEARFDVTIHRFLD